MKKLSRLIPAYTWLYLILGITLTSCTLAVQNIASEGTAENVGDDSQATDPDFTATIPLK